MNSYVKSSLYVYLHQLNSPVWTHLTQNLRLWRLNHCVYSVTIGVDGHQEGRSKSRLSNHSGRLFLLRYHTKAPQPSIIPNTRSWEPGRLSHGWAIFLPSGINLMAGLLYWSTGIKSRSVNSSLSRKKDLIILHIKKDYIYLYWLYEYPL